MNDAILVVNAGSSSVKFAIYRAAGRPNREDLMCNGACEGVGGRLRLKVVDSSGAALADELPGGEATAENALNSVLGLIECRYQNHQLAGAGHRVLHGGSNYFAPVLLDKATIDTLRGLIPLAPLHQPQSLAAIAAISTLHPALPQIACFDTAFHHTQSETARAFALPRRFADEGIRRYGFHGLSYEYIASVLPDVIGAEAAHGRVVIAHLGSGASLCALRNCKSVATTMSFTALDGLPMGRRCGSLDPGVILYLMQEKGMTASAVCNLLYWQSGLFGASGISDDMRALLASDQASAKEAVAIFIYQTGLALGAMAAALGGMDALVFTAGIGEHAPEIRRRVCAQAAWLGLRIDEIANAEGGPRISSLSSQVSAWAIPTDEDLMIARHTWDVLNATTPR